MTKSIMFGVLLAFIFISQINCESLGQSDLEGNIEKSRIIVKLITKLEALEKKYLHLKGLLEEANELNEELNENDNDKKEQNDFDGKLGKRSRFSLTSMENPERFGKGKRVYKQQKNMFASGLQGVWGVPGRK